MNEEQSFWAALAADPTDMACRLAYADWLEDRGHPGADYLRTEFALARAEGGEATSLRRKALDLIPRLPRDWRDRFEQPDLLLAPPVPFAMGWYSECDSAPRPYRSLPNLPQDMLSATMPWLTGKGFRQRLDQAEHEEQELAALTELEDRAVRLGLRLPHEFAAFARDFRRRGAVQGQGSYCEVCLHDPVINDFPQVGEGHLVLFFGDMNYGNPHQLAWSLYLVPGVDWHCVVVFELTDDANNLLPDDPKVIFYCAPSFQAFLARWSLGRVGQAHCM